MPPKKKSNVEAMRRYRAQIKGDPAAHEAYLQKEKQRYQKRKQAGNIQNINNMPPREQRSLRRKWKLEKRQQRMKANNENSSVQEDIDTPPPSPMVEMRDDSPPPIPSHQKKAGRRKVRRENRKSYRTINKQKETIKQLEQIVRRLKKKLSRSEAKDSKTEDRQQINTKVTVESSPATRATALLQSGDFNNVRKQLTYGFALSAEIREKLKHNAKTHRERQAVHRIIKGKILKKYRLLAKAKQDMKLSRKRLAKINETALGTTSLLEYKRKQKESETADLVKSFYLQDINSAPASGKKETITRKQVKMQKRFLCDSLFNLHQKFKAENPKVKVSYTTFTRSRPFYVISPTVDQRDTVKCKLHHNCEFKAAKLHSLGILAHKDPYKIMKDIVCSVREKDCMYLVCKKCKGKWSSMYKNEENNTSTQIITYTEWQNQKEQRTTNKGKVISVKTVKKIQRSDTVANLCKLFEKELKLLMPHQYRIFHQYKAIKEIKEKLAEDECVLQMDFSENYACKAETEIQAMHFGASRNQISLHTCHATLKDTVKCYCTVSEDLRHSAESIWAHLEPVLDDLSKNGIKVLHFLSDGPTTQYRNKTNFHLFSTLPFRKWDFHRLTYNFLEASHGKGPADGIGAAVKNTADRIVAHGQDILNVKDLIDALQNKVKVTLYEITGAQINSIENLIKKSSIKPIKGTMKIHQLMMLSKGGSLYHREISCFCSWSKADGLCNCHLPAEVQIGRKADSAVTKIENKLNKEQIAKFEKRFEEGYDVIIHDLDSMGEEKKKEYLYWKVWKAAKLQDNTQEDINPEEDVEMPADGEEDMDLESEDEYVEEEMDLVEEFENFEKEIDLESETENMEDTMDLETLINEVASNSDRKTVEHDKHSELETISEVPAKIQGTNFPEMHGYYAVFFHAHRGKKGTFYIGRVVRTDGETAELKFLETKSGNAKKRFVWPLRDDILSINTAYILHKVAFNGPPPFELETSEYNMIQQLVKDFEM